MSDRRRHRALGAARARRRAGAGNAGRPAWSIALVAGLVAAACAEPTGPAAETPVAPDRSVQQIQNDLAGNVFWNACTGEFVGFAEGSIQHVVIRVKDDGDGGFHVGVHRNGQNYHGPGLEWTGSEFEPTGTQYRGNGVFNGTLNMRPPFPAEQTITSNVRVIQLGSGENMMFHLVDHITINAKGEVTADVVDAWFICQ